MVAERSTMGACYWQTRPRLPNLLDNNERRQSDLLQQSDKIGPPLYKTVQLETFTYLSGHYIIHKNSLATHDLQVCCISRKVHYEYLLEEKERKTTNHKKLFIWYKPDIDD